MPRSRVDSRLAALCCIAAAATATALPAWAGAAGAQVATSKSAKPAATVDVATYPFKLPRGYANLVVATVPEGSDVWAAASDSSTTTLFRFDPKTHALTRFPESCPMTVLEPRAQLAVAQGGGTVWLATNQTLVRLQVSTALVTCIAIPGPILDPYFAPTQITLPAVDGMAVSAGDGLVALSLFNYTSGLEIYHPGTPTWTTPSLPSGATPYPGADDLAYLADGRLLMTVEGTNVRGSGLFMSKGSGFVKVGTDGSPTTVVAQGDHFVTTNAAFAVGSEHDGVVTEKLVTHSGTPILPSTSSPTVGSAAAFLGGSELAVPSTKGIEVIQTSDGQTRELSLGTQPGGPARLVSPGVTVPFPTSVPVTALALMPDGNGNLWFIPDTNTPEIGEVLASRIG